MMTEDIGDIRLKELMQYHSDRITRETIDKISTKLAQEYLEKNKYTLIDMIDNKKVYEMAMRHLEVRLWGG